LVAKVLGPAVDATGTDSGLATIGNSDFDFAFFAVE
jgi:hypothetical protein